MIRNLNGKVRIVKPSSPFLISLDSALVTSALLLAASPSHATSGGYYTATPVAAPAAVKLVVRDTLWKCGEAGCAASAKSNSRPAIVCQALAGKVGALAAFRAGTEEFDAAALAKCNARA